MPKKQVIDPACLTSVVDTLYCPDAYSTSGWAYNTARAATFHLIIDPQLGVSPPYEGGRPSVGPYSVLESGLSLVSSDIPKVVRAAAEDSAKLWESDDNNRETFKKSFMALKDTKEFETWVYLEGIVIWLNHVRGQGCLFNEQLIPGLAGLLDK